MYSNSRKNRPYLLTLLKNDLLTRNLKKGKDEKENIRTLLPLLPGVH